MNKKSNWNLKIRGFEKYNLRELSGNIIFFSFKLWHFLTWMNDRFGKLILVFLTTYFCWAFSYELYIPLCSLFIRLDANYEIDWNFAPDSGFIFLYLKSKKSVENPLRYAYLPLPKHKKPVFLIFECLPLISFELY